jgi:arylsulfatase A-like enzyme
MNIKKTCMVGGAFLSGVSSLISADDKQVETSVQKAKRRPNIIFIEADDLLYRFAGKTGRGFVLSPNLDYLAANGVYFSNAVCQGVMCGPSRNSLITGLYPHNIGFYRNGQMHALPDNIWSMGEGMKRAGYNTAWVGKCHVHPPENGSKYKSSAEGLMKNMGFNYAVASLGRAMLASRIRKGKHLKNDVYFDYLKEKGLYETYVNDCKNKKAVTSLSEDDYLDGFYTNTALKWIDDNKSKQPLFLWLNFSCPHGPHDAPQKYHDLYKDRTIPPPETTDFGGVQIPEPLLVDSKPYRPARIEKIRRAYAANCTFVDAMVGKVISKLKKDNMLDNTMIVFFSDHGIFMGNHGRRHKGTIFKEVTQPSLIIYYPKEFKKGYIDKSPVELLSILKTALAVAGADKKDFDTPYGESLLPLLTGKGKYNTKYAFSEIAGAQMCTDGRYRFYLTPNGVLLYDLQEDPNEMKNIAQEKPDVVERMKKAVKEWFEKTGDPLPVNYLKDKEHLKNFKRKMRFDKNTI